jgi:hypothetical protein
MNRDQALEYLRDWKAQQMQVESQWDEQQIAKLLGAKPGQSCRKVIQEKVPQLVALTADLHNLIAQWQKAADTYLRQHPIPPGSRPTEITQEQQHCANSAGAFRVCAHELKNLLTKHTKI